MAEILFRVIDKFNPDPLHDPYCTKRGDVIVVVDNDWPWGSEELTNPEWVIIKLPNIAKESLQFLLEPEALDRKVFPYAQKRGRRVQIDGLPQNIKNKLSSGPAIYTWNFTEAQLANYIETKTPIPDPNIL